MEPESDDEEQISPNTFIVLDSQRPPRLDEGENQAAGEREADCHAATLKNLEISRASCPETPAHLQGSEVKQKHQVGVILYFNTFVPAHFQPHSYSYGQKLKTTFLSTKWQSAEAPFCYAKKCCWQKYGLKLLAMTVYELCHH